MLNKLQMKRANTKHQSIFKIFTILDSGEYVEPGKHRSDRIFKLLCISLCLWHTLPRQDSFSKEGAQESFFAKRSWGLDFNEMRMNTFCRVFQPWNLSIETFPTFSSRQTPSWQFEPVAAAAEAKAGVQTSSPRSSWSFWGWTDPLYLTLPWISRRETRVITSGSFESLAKLPSYPGWHDRDGTLLSSVGNGYNNFF